jgi:serine/threonine protein kinase
MKESFLSNEGQDEYLNIVMDYFSDNLYQVIKKKEISPLLMKLYAYQIFRGLNYLAMLSIAHRDIKPQNILVDRVKHKVIVSDFGSAKQLTKGNVFLTQGRRTLPISVRDAIALLNSFLERLTIRLRSICGRQAAAWLK